jgi:formyl-CoA transferase
MIRQVRLPDGAPLRVPAVVPKLGDTPGDIGEIGPKLGQHNDEILGRLGYSPSDIAGLRARKVV